MNTTRICWVAVALVVVAAHRQVVAGTTSDSGRPRTVTAPAKAKPTTYVAGTGTLYKQGEEAIKRGDFSAAVAPLEEAVRRQPNDAQSRFALAIAYAKTKQSLQGWIQVRKVVRIDPDHKNATRFFMQYWSHFDGQGVVNVGRDASGALVDGTSRPEAVHRRPHALAVWVHGHRL